MEPFAVKSGRRPQLHWWIVAGVAGAFFVWTFDLVPRIRSAATGTVAESRSDAQEADEDGELELDDDWSVTMKDSRPTTDQFETESDDSLLGSMSSRPVRSPGQFSEPAEMDAEPGAEAKTRNAVRRSVQDSEVAAASYESADAEIVSDFRSSEVVADSNPVIPADVAAQLREIDDWFQDDLILEAHAELSRIYWKHPELRPVIQERIDHTASLIFTTPERQFGPPHFVDYGETLESIAKQYDVPWAYLAMLNRVTPQKLQAGTEIKVIRGPFGAVVDLEAFCLTVHAHGWYVNHYVIGIGRDEKTPLGEFTVKDKLENPTWYDPDGGVVDPDDPENPLGEYWLGLGNHIGIHGTNDPDSIGKAASRGCIHLNDEDISEVFGLLGTGSKVMIRK